MQRIITVALGVVIALAALSAASAQQEPPYRFYGSDATPGDEIAAVVEHGDHHDTVASTTVAEDGTWYIDVDRDMADEIEFTVNGKHATAEITPKGDGQASVTLTVAMMEEDSMDEGDEMMGEDDGEMMGEDDEMLDEDDSMDDSMEGAYPSTGSGGLADGGLSAGLIGLLVILGGVAVAGFGLRRLRNRV